MPFNDFFSRLFGLKDSLPTCKAIKRSPSYLSDYQAWVNGQKYLPYTQGFFKAYHYKKAGMPAEFRVQLVEGENLRGALFFYDPRFKPVVFSFFFDFLKERAQAQGYTVHTSNTLQVRHERYLEQIWKVVLTPPASDVPGSSLCNQLYGNVLLDFVEVNNKPGFIRLAANSYNDAFFSKPLPFDQLMEQVLK